MLDFTFSLGKTRESLRTSNTCASGCHCPIFPAQLKQVLLFGKTAQLCPQSLLPNPLLRMGHPLSAVNNLQVVTNTELSAHLFPLGQDVPGKKASRIQEPGAKTRSCVCKLCHDVEDSFSSKTSLNLFHHPGLRFLRVNINFQKTSILDRNLLQMNCICSPNKQVITPLLWTFTMVSAKETKLPPFHQWIIRAMSSSPTKTSAHWVCKYYQRHLVCLKAEDSSAALQGPVTTSVSLKYCRVLRLSLEAMSSADHSGKLVLL